MNPAPAILWFRNDLRLTDNPALVHAVSRNARLLPVYIHDPAASGEWPMGAASRWWLHHSLKALDDDLRRAGSGLLICEGDTERVLAELVEGTGAEALCWNRRYEPAHIELDQRIKRRFLGQGLAAESFNGTLVNEPWKVLKGDGTPYRVFTPYWKACLKAGGPGDPLPAPDGLPPLPPEVQTGGLDRLGLLPTIPWDRGFYQDWTPGEAGALGRLETFVAGPLSDYTERRDRPAEAGTSGLSTHLHFGEISPRQVFAALRAPDPEGCGPFLRQLYWREFAHQLLFHFPHTTQRPLVAKFEAFPWRTDYRADLERWQQGLTGIPLVDAGMRELWAIGSMHNRVRMVAASFLTKHLLIPWQEGARWFWDTLVDADLANNSMGWQWVAGSGADAAPYFRIFNPATQGERFDPAGEYLRRWLPELRDLPPQRIHQPWKPGGPPAGYPAPLVDLREGRALAMSAYDTIR